jgi:hypothetical protein
LANDPGACWLNISFKKMKFDFDSPNRIPGKSKLERVADRVRHSQRRWCV